MDGGWSDIRTAGQKTIDRNEEKNFLVFDTEFLSVMMSNERAREHLEVRALCMQCAISCLLSWIDARDVVLRQIAGYFFVDMKSALGNNPTLFFW